MKHNELKKLMSQLDITQADFNALSHLPVSTMLDVIQAHFTISGNYEQSKQLLAWTMGTKFIDSCGDVDMRSVCLGGHTW